MNELLSLHPAFFIVTLILLCSAGILWYFLRNPQKRDERTSSPKTATFTVLQSFHSLLQTDETRWNINERDMTMTYQLPQDSSSSVTFHQDKDVSSLWKLTCRTNQSVLCCVHFYNYSDLNKTEKIKLLYNNKDNSIDMTKIDEFFLPLFTHLKSICPFFPITPIKQGKSEEELLLQVLQTPHFWENQWFMDYHFKTSIGTHTALATFYHQSTPLFIFVTKENQCTCAWKEEQPTHIADISLLEEPISTYVSKYLFPHGNSKNLRSNTVQSDNVLQVHQKVISLYAQLKNNKHLLSVSSLSELECFNPSQHTFLIQMQKEHHRNELIQLHSLTYLKEVFQGLKKLDYEVKNAKQRQKA